MWTIAKFEETYGLGSVSTDPSLTKHWSAIQQVDSDIRADPWCTWEDALDMLIQSAISANRDGLHHGGGLTAYRLVKDLATDTLTLELWG